METKGKLIKKKYFL